MTSPYRAERIPYIFLPLQRASVFISPLIGKQAGKRQRDVVAVRAAVFVRMLGQAGGKQRRDTGAYAIEQGSPIRQVGYWVWRLPVRVVPAAWLADLMRAL